MSKHNYQERIGNVPWSRSISHLPSHSLSVTFDLDVSMWATVTNNLNYCGIKE
jgi:hypothetical protein